MGMKVHRQHTILIIRVQMMEKHPVSSVGHRYVLIVYAVRIDTHTGQSISVFRKAFLKKIIVDFKSLLNLINIPFLAEGKLQIVV